MRITASEYDFCWFSKEDGPDKKYRYLCMDEADRMIDMGFEEDVRSIMSHFKVSHVFRLQCSCINLAIPVPTPNPSLLRYHAS